MKRVSALVVTAFALLTSACHEVEVVEVYEDSYVIDYTPDIRYFSLRPAVGAHAWQSGATPITPYLDSGNFELQWEIRTYGQYHVDLFVSNDPWIGPPDPWGREDLLFKQITGIGSNYGDAYHVDTVFMNCRFTTNNVLSCGALNYDNPGRDITPFLPQLPKTGYVILRACEAFMEYCATSSLFVELQ